MNELAQRFRQELRRKQFDEIETTWLELVESDVSPDELFELAELAGKYGPADKLPVLLSVLAESLGEKGRVDEQLRALRRQAELTPDDVDLARRLAVCIQRLHGEVTDFEQLLHKSGVGFGQSLKEALPKLDRYLSLVPGSLVYDAERGPGKVKKLDLLLDRVTVDFDMGAVLTWDVAAARNRLRVASRDGYFVRLNKDRRGLQETATTAPGAVVAMYLRDTGRPATVKDVQLGLEPVVRPADWEGFWNRARKDLARDPHVVCRTSPGRTYVWVDEPVQVPGKSTSAKDSRTVRQDIDAEGISTLSPDKVQALFDKLTTFHERKRFLDVLPAARPADCDRLLAWVFQSTSDNRARTIAEKELREKRPESWQALFEGTLTGYRQNPEAFLWLLEHGGRGVVSGPKGLVSRILDLLESDVHRTYWNRLRNALVDSDYGLVRAALDTMDEAEAGRMAARVKRIRLLEGYRADEIIQLIVARFPDLGGAEDENVILTTQRGLDKAKQELRNLTGVEIPRSAEEIARARAHGDLSENYEYKAAKEKQARLMTRMKVLRDELARARVVGPQDVDTSEVSFGCRVRLRDAEGQETGYVILGPWEADTERGVISSLSPFARLLTGKKMGESVEASGRTFTLLAIESGLPA